jgi:hypothetical protein
MTKKIFSSIILRYAVISYTNYEVESNDGEIHGLLVRTLGRTVLGFLRVSIRLDGLSTLKTCLESLFQLISPICTELNANKPGLVHEFRHHL